MSLNHQSLIIVTYGRTGSTLLQGVLNAIPGCLIRGENYNFCFGLYQSWKSLRRSHDEFGAEASAHPESPWFGAYRLDADRFLISARQIVESQLVGGADAPRPACLGFKEIRYLQDSLGGGAQGYAAQLHDYLEFLARLLPGLGIVFLTRDHEQVCRSAWWRDRDPAKVVQSLRAFEAAARSFRSEICRTFEIDYADLLANGVAVQRLFDFLGASYDPEQVAAVLGREHSFKPPQTDPSGALATTQPPADASQPTWRAELGASLRGFSWVSSDRPAWPDGPDGRCVWNGVAVASAAPESTRLGLILPGGEEVPVTWGQPSPRAAARFPDRPWAATARYRLPEFTLSAGQSVSLIGHGPAGDEMLARLERRL